MEILSDGRTISRFTEEWTCDVFGYLRPGSDSHGFDVVDQNACRYSVKSVTKNGTAVRFSSNTGVGRKCTEDDVLKAIDRVEAFVFVDNTKLPEIYLIQIPKQILKQWFDRKIMSRKNGTIIHAKFWDEVTKLEARDV